MKDFNNQQEHNVGLTILQLTPSEFSSKLFKVVK